MKQSPEPSGDKNWRHYLFNKRINVPGTRFVESIIRSLFSLKALRRVLIGFAIFITLIAIVWTEENIRGKLAWDRYEKELRAKGEPTRLEDIIPPSVPDDQNFAMAPCWEDISRMFGGREESGFTDEEWNLAAKRNQINLHLEGYNDVPKFPALWENRPIDLDAWQSYFRQKPSPELDAPFFPTHPIAQTPGEDIRLALSVYDELLTGLRTASKLPYSRFPVRYENNINALLPHLSRLRLIAQINVLRGAVELSEGNSDRALDSLKFNLRIRDSIATEPLLISFLVRAAVHNISLDIVWEGMLEHRWSSEQLNEIERLLTDDDWFKAYVLGIRGERAMTIEMLKRLIQGDEEVTRMLGGPNDSTGAEILKAVPDGFVYQNIIRLARFHQELNLNPIDSQENRVYTSQEDREERTILEMGRFHPYTFIARQIVPAFGKVGFKAARAQALSHLAATACALERYFLDNRKYPESLDELVPTYTAALLRDPFNGAPLRYNRQSPSSYKLYSVGENLADDGGVIQKERESIYEALDLTWPVGIPREAQSSQ